MDRIDWYILHVCPLVSIRQRLIKIKVNQIHRFLLFSNFLNKFRYYSIVAVPGFLGALGIFATPNKIAIMFAHSALVMVNTQNEFVS